MTVRKKLIEVSIPLEAINAASAKEKSIRHGHPSTLHLWWARRPLAACRAVLFAQLVDDPSSWPDRFPTKEEQDAERRRLHKIIEAMVPWEASNNEAILNAARWEIARSVAWGLGEEPPPRDNPKAILDYLQTKAPPVYDPFSGGGSIPLEAQRLGLRAYGSDLNPVAVLIGKALVEIPPKFAGLPPVNPKAREDAKFGQLRSWRGAQGLAEDVRYYGQWMRDEAEKRIGHLYPKAKLPDGSEATVIAWLWARTVRSPDPAAKGAMVPLMSSFLLSAKEGRKAWVVPVIDTAAPGGWRFEIKSGALGKIDEAQLKLGTKTGRGSFKCLLTGAAISSSYIKSEIAQFPDAKRLVAIIAEGPKGKVFLSPSADHETVAQSAPQNDNTPNAGLPADPRAFTPTLYGLDSIDKLFSKRQASALATFAELVVEVRRKVVGDATSSGRDAEDYANAIATYLGLAVGRAADFWSSLAIWEPSGTFISHAFATHAIRMIWDCPEANPFCSGNGSWVSTALEWTVKALAELPAISPASIALGSAQSRDYGQQRFVFSTDPPYYDNIPYADLSDYFYGWHRLSLQEVHPTLYRRIAVPKDEELVATAYRHGGRKEADTFFHEGMKEALSKIANAPSSDFPVAIYYAFKQTEEGQDGVVSAGWASFIQAILDSNLGIDGTWPIRTERPVRTRSINSNALASSIVLVCRPRSANATVITRSEFIRALKQELPEAIEAIRKAGVGPVDMQQSIIGPGMGIFSRYAKVLEDDDSVMTVRTALSLINRVWEEIENELDAAFDPETQVALAWYTDYGFDARASGNLIMLANAKNISSDALFSSGVFSNLKGKAALTARAELRADWSPATDKSPTVWECVQHTARALTAEDGGAEAAAQLVAQMGTQAVAARALAYRLFEIATKRGWNQEALVYNELAQEWPRLEDLASSGPPLGLEPAQASLL